MPYNHRAGERQNPLPVSSLHVIWRMYLQRRRIRAFLARKSIATMGQSNAELDFLESWARRLWRRPRPIKFKMSNAVIADKAHDASTWSWSTGLFAWHASPPRHDSTCCLLVVFTFTFFLPEHDNLSQFSSFFGRPCPFHCALYYLQQREEYIIIISNKNGSAGAARLEAGCWKPKSLTSRRVAMHGLLPNSGASLHGLKS